MVDNGSTDHTRPVIARLAVEMSNLRHVTEPVRGLSRARNTALREARGELLAFLDDDAVAAPCWLEALLEAYSARADVVAVGGRTFPRWPGDRPRWLPAERDRYYGRFDLGDERCPMPSGVYPFGTNMAIARDALVGVGGFPPGLGRCGRRLLSNEEKHVFRKLTEAGGEVLYEPAAVVHHDVLAERLTLPWVLSRAFAQGRSNVIDEALTGAGRQRSRWFLRSLRSVRKAAVQLVTAVGPTPADLVRSASRASHWMGAATQCARFAAAPGSLRALDEGTEQAGPLRVAARPAVQTRNSNPYTSLLWQAVTDAGATVEELTRQGLFTSRYDIVHLHWPESALRARSAVRAVERPLTLLGALAFARARGARLVWTVHNLDPHETSNPLMARVLWPAFTALVDGVVSLTESGVEPALRQFPRLRDKPVFVIPHGHYRCHYPDDVGTDEARAELGVADADRVLLFFGKIRPYKNVPALLSAFAGLEDPAARLLVAGRPSSPDLQRHVALSTHQDDRVRHHLGFVPRERVQLFFRASDLVVLPYLRVFNSGTALLALSFDCPVLVPALPVFEELQEKVGDEWVRTYRGELGPGDLERGLAGGRPGSAAPLSHLDWPAIGDETMAAYRALLGHGRP